MKRCHYILSMRLLAFVILLIMTLFAAVVSSVAETVEPAAVSDESTEVTESTETIDSAANNPIDPYITIYYYHETECGSCDGDKEFYDIFAEKVVDKTIYPYKIYPRNVYNAGGMEHFRSTMALYGHSTENISFPVMIINSKLYTGKDAIENNINEAYLTAGEDMFDYGYVYNRLTADKDIFARFNANPDNSTLLYFYRTVCAECNSVKPFIDQLPQDVIVNDSTTPVDLIRLNTRSGNNGEIIYALFDKYQVPDKDRKVPIIFLTDRYLSGKDMIEKELMTALEAGEGLGFEFPSGSVD